MGVVIPLDVERPIDVRERGVGEDPARPRDGVAQHHREPAVASTDRHRDLVVVVVVLDVGQREPLRLLAVANSRSSTSTMTSRGARVFVTASKSPLHF